MRKFIGFLLIIALIVLLYMQFYPPPEKLEKLPESAAYKAFTDHHAYDVLLKDGARVAYDKLAKMVYSEPREDEDEGDNFFGRIYYDEKKGVDETQIYLGYKAYLEDHPEVFWLEGNQFMYKTGKLGLERIFDHARIRSFFDADTLKKMIVEQNAAVAAFLETVPAGLSTLELQEYTHDYLIDLCEYDYDALEENEDDSIKLKSTDTYLAGSAYGALVKHKAVCAGYAKAYQLLLNRLGVDCVYVSGRGVDENGDFIERYGASNHAWNAVYDGAAWSMTDPTWDDVEQTEYRHHYFNLSIEEMYRDHAVNPFDQTIYKYSPFFTGVMERNCIFLPS